MRNEFLVTEKEQLQSFSIENWLLGEEDLDSSESLFDSGVLDSTGFTELVGFLETRFGINIPNEDLVPENLGSVTSIEDFVARKLEEVVSRGSVVL